MCECACGRTSECAVAPCAWSGAWASVGRLGRRVRVCGYMKGSGRVTRWRGRERVAGRSEAKCVDV
eukprot:scaffold2610_cov115-Isochrysis_galbana.AAC.3